MLLFEIIIGLVVVSGLGTLWYKHENDFHKRSEQAVLPDQSVEEKKIESTGTLRITVTYVDGLTEVFFSSDEITVGDGGTVMFRLDNNSCVTIAASAFRKVTEEYQY